MVLRLKDGTEIGDQMSDNFFESTETHTLAVSCLSWGVDFEALYLSQFSLYILFLIRTRIYNENSD
jgi:hypothetical protein